MKIKTETFPYTSPIKSSHRKTKSYYYIKHRDNPCYLDLIVLTCRTGYM